MKLNKCCNSRRDIIAIRKHPIYGPIFTALKWMGGLREDASQTYMYIWKIPKTAILPYSLLTALYLSLICVLLYNIHSNRENFWLVCVMFQVGELSAVFSYSFLFSKDTVFAMLNKLEEHVTDRELRHFSKLVKYPVVAICTLVFGYNAMVSAMFFFKTEELHFHCQLFFFGLDSRQYYATCLMMTVFELCSVTTLAYLFAFIPMIIYIAGIYHICLKFEAFRASLQKTLENSSKTSAKDLIQLRRQLVVIVDCIDNQNAVFYYSALYCYSVATRILCTFVILLLTGIIFQLKFFAGIYIVGIFVTVLLFISGFAIVVFKLDNKDFYSPTILHRIVANHSYFDLQFAIQVDALVMQLRNSKGRLNLSRFFVFDRQAILRIGGAFWSYIVIVLQFNNAEDVMTYVYEDM